MGQNAFLGYGTRISNAGVIKLGNNFKISASSIIMCKKSVTIGNDVLISWGTTITDTDWHHICDSEGKTINADDEVIIDEHVWIGSNVMILKGSRILKDSVVAAGAIITKAFGETNILLGNTNQVLRRNINWVK